MTGLGGRLDMIFARQGMGYVGLWDRGGVEISADRLRRRSGELHAELVVSAAASPAGHGKLHRASFNLSSTVSRERLGKVLEGRSRSGQSIPWPDLLEEFCAAVLEAERKGSPIVSVGRMPPQAAEGWLVEPLLPEGKVTIVFAPGGIGKSYLAVLVSVAVATDTSVLGWRVRSGPVLYLDWETDAYEVDRRVKRVAAGLGVETPQILYRACAGGLDDMVEDLADTIARERVVLTIVDSVGMASGGGSREGPAEETAIRLFAAFRHLKTTVLAIDHVTGEDVRSDRAIAKPYGSIYKVNLARSVWELKGTVAEDGEDSHMALFHRKVNSGRLGPPIGILVSHGDDAVEFRREQVDDPKLVQGLSHSARISRALAAGSMSVAEIAEETEIGEPIVRVVLNRGRGKQFGKLGDGRWGLLMHGTGGS